ncbi:hypothetical protein MMC11_008679 [Xylographa trunciseda]|nr:hypothetical protein [Xylographa trunciseda]
MDTTQTEKGNIDSSEANHKTVRTIRGIKWVFVVAAILSSVFLFALDNSIVADVQPKIIEAFPGSIDKLPWISVAFALGAASTTLVWATLFTTFDAKYNYLIAVFLFEVGSAICGAANMMNVLIFGRVLAGLGGAGAYVGVLTLLTALTEAQERPLYIASTGMVWGLGSVLGPIFGGLFGDSPATWRWCFYINLVVAAVFCPAYFLFLPRVDPQPHRSMNERFHELDYAGIFLIIAAFALGITGLSFGGSLFAWNSATIVAPLVISFVLIILFGVQQTLSLFTTPDRRLFPVHFLKSRTMILMFIESAASGAGIFIPVYFIPLFYQFAEGTTALSAAVRLLPFLCLLVFFSLLNGAILSKDGHYAPWYVGATALIVIGSSLMYTVNETTSTAAIYGYSSIIGIGAGCTFQAGFIVAQAAAPRSEMSLAVAYINLAQISGLVIVLTLANTIFLNVAQENIAAVLPTADSATIQLALSGTASSFLQTLSPAVQAQVLHAIISAISKTYILAIAGGALGLVCALAMKWERLVLEV